LLHGEVEGSANRGLVRDVTSDADRARERVGGGDRAIAVEVHDGDASAL
jgi:hypothetical protein